MRTEHKFFIGAMAFAGIVSACCGVDLNKEFVTFTSTFYAISCGLLMGAMTVLFGTRVSVILGDKLKTRYKSVLDSIVDSAKCYTAINMTGLLFGAVFILGDGGFSYEAIKVALSGAILALFLASLAFFWFFTLLVLDLVRLYAYDEHNIEEVLRKN